MIKNILKKISNFINESLIDYWNISANKFKLAYQVIEQACQSKCDELGIIIEYCDNLNDDKVVEHNKLNLSNPMKTYGTYSYAENKICLLNHYEALNEKYNTWIHEIGHYYDRTNLVKILNYSETLIKGLDNVKDYKEFYHLRNLIDKNMQLFDKNNELEVKEFNADLQGLNEVLRKLPAWVLWVWSIVVRVYWKECLPTQSKDNDKYMSDNNYLKFFNITATDVVTSYKSYLKSKRS
jgi:hypothetical protein